jgi:hypothetical protein
MAAVVALASASFAQKGNNQIGIGAEVGIPTGDFGEAMKAGFGGAVKGLYGIGTAGQITGTVGYTSFKMKGSSEDAKMSIGILPILAGYRHNFSGFYVEPQVGYSIVRAKVDMLGQSESDSEGAFAGLPVQAIKSVVWIWVFAIRLPQKTAEAWASLASALLRTFR